MSTQKNEVIYETDGEGYFETTRPSDDPSILLANERNVLLSYTRCNQIMKADPPTRSSRSLPSKTGMFRSETNVSTNCNEEGRGTEQAHLLVEKRIQRTLVSRSFHFGKEAYTVQGPLKTEQDERRNQNYQYELQQIRKFKNSQGDQDRLTSSVVRRVVQSNEANEIRYKNDPKSVGRNLVNSKLERSYHLSETPSKTEKPNDGKGTPYTNDKGSSYTNGKGSPSIIINSQLGVSHQHQRNIPQSTLKHVAYKLPTEEPTPSSSIGLNRHPSKQMKGQPCPSTTKGIQQPDLSIDQLSRLQWELAKKEGELYECQRTLQTFELRSAQLQKETQEIRQKANWIIQNTYTTSAHEEFSSYSSHRKGVELANGLGGSTNALLYFLFFFTLLAKTTLSH